MTTAIWHIPTIYPTIRWPELPVPELLAQAEALTDALHAVGAVPGVEALAEALAMRVHDLATLDDFDLLRGAVRERYEVVSAAAAPLIRPGYPRRAPLSDRQAVESVHALLAGTEWNADTHDAIAAVIVQTGRVIAEPEPTERVGPSVIVGIDHTRPGD